MLTASQAGEKPPRSLLFRNRSNRFLKQMYGGKNGFTADDSGNSTISGGNSGSSGRVRKNT
ncbi:hypothetical protein DDR33_15795 [Pararcticibacter amylolyticus]|uniref:Uncharacterized protein n=1 Tax=Pararcticibacter amylolyticus TaxID=2173175 RepID=A0A2U2PDZ8_9SPHI|nr:hypothetical protein DDR33_15795 [Pararcticibacter amylolyticus]